MNMLPPIILFTYNRADTLIRVLYAIKIQTQLPEKLIIFSDAGKVSYDHGVLEVRNTLKNIDWIETEIIKRPINFGCARNIIHGITAVFNHYDKAVIIEDDVLPARHFYESMTTMLEHYKHEQQVFAVGGYPTVANTIINYPYDVIMSPRFSCWGWGTWADRWDQIVDDLMAKRLPYNTPDEIPTHAGEDIQQAFSSVKSRPDFYWDYPISLHCLKNKWMHAITNYYLVNNIGITSGEHGIATPKDIKFFEDNNMVQDKLPTSFPEASPDFAVESAIFDYLNSQRDDHSQNNYNKFSKYSFIIGIAKKFYQKIKSSLISLKLLLALQISDSPNPKNYSTSGSIGSVVPCQIEAYFLALNKYLNENETVLDVGFGLGYGLNVLAIKASFVSGVDIDPKVLEYCYNTIRGRNPKLNQLELYDGYHLQFLDNHFDLVTCVDVLEHVEDYHRFLDELLRVAKKGVFISTPNRRPEYTNPDGTPKNYWHLREWSYEELDEILKEHGEVDWNFLNGPFEGPFSHSIGIANDTLTLSPFLFKK